MNSPSGTEAQALGPSALGPRSPQCAVTSEFTMAHCLGNEPSSFSQAPSKKGRAEMMVPF